ncbi:hypothetical protein NVP2117O_13 [Vibrio phage 2.117.O._10N.261.45.E9]|nr:hypothetical protein NVP1117O_13 [Vibrio phage 1.117.O._10N.261.45.E9]AUR95414.1 hypothetical protein NVP1207B_07 [Vibrio phage 1.207.B._10N.222.51.C2]AUS02305.1 hypothetical protein NVP2117O_13 [Vibrio phage 2.117.O._10N.261.45.E9]
MELITCPSLATAPRYDLVAHRDGGVEKVTLYVECDDDQPMQSVAKCFIHGNPYAGQIVKAESFETMLGAIRYRYKLHLTLIKLQ